MTAPGKSRRHFEFSPPQNDSLQQYLRNDQDYQDYFDQYNQDWEDYHAGSHKPAEKRKPALTVSDPGDASEEAADRIAARVMAGEQTDPVPVMEPEMLQAKHEAGGSVEPSADFENKLQSSKGGGTAIDDSVRSEMENRMQADFSQTKIHTDPAAHDMAQKINAKAFTHGQDIYFGKQESPANKELLAHELVHIRQQPAAASHIHRMIDQPGAIKIVQQELGVPLSGTWDDATNQSLQANKIDQPDHEALLEYMFLRIIGESKAARESRKKKIENIKPDLEAVLETSRQGRVLYAYIWEALLQGISNNNYDYEAVKTALPLILDLDAAALLPGLSGKKPEEKDREYLNYSVKDEMADINLNKDIAAKFARMKGAQAESEYLKKSAYTESDLPLIDKFMPGLGAKAGDMKGNIEVLARTSYARYSEIDILLSGQDKLASGTMSLGDNKTGSMNTIFLEISAHKQKILDRLTEYNPAQYDDAIKENQRIIAEYDLYLSGKKKTKTSLDDIRAWKEQAKANIGTSINNKETIKTNLVSAVGRSLAWLAYIYNELILDDVHRGAAQYLESIKDTEFIKDLEKRKQEFFVSSPQRYQQLVYLTLDQMDINIADSNILTIHHDARIPALQPASVVAIVSEANGANGTGSVIADNQYYGVVLFETGNQKTILLNHAAFESKATMKAAIGAAVAVADPAVSTVTYKKQILATGSTESADAIAKNKATWTDPRSVRIIQDYMGAPMTGDFDERTVDHIAHWQSLQGIKTREKGVAGIEELRTMFYGLVQGRRKVRTDGKKFNKIVSPGGNYNDAIQLILDYFNLFDALASVDARGEPVNNPPPARKNQTYEMLMDTYYMRDALPDMQSEAAATFDNSGKPSMVRMGDANMADFERAVSTLTHELLHVKQNETGNIPTPATEMYAEYMELRGKLGNTQLPVKTLDEYSGDFFRASKEYLRLRDGNLLTYAALMKQIYDQYKTIDKDVDAVISKYISANTNQFTNNSNSINTGGSSLPEGTAEYRRAVIRKQRMRLHEQTLVIVNAILELDTGLSDDKINNIVTAMAPFALQPTGADGMRKETLWPGYNPLNIDAGTTEAINTAYIDIKSEIYNPISRADNVFGVEIQKVQDDIRATEAEQEKLRKEKQDLLDKTPEDKRDKAFDTSLDDIKVKMEAEKTKREGLQKKLDELTKKRADFRKNVFFDTLYALYQKRDV